LLAATEMQNEMTATSASTGCSTAREATTTRYLAVPVDCTVDTTLLHSCCTTTTSAATAGDGGWLPWDGPAGVSAAGSDGLASLSARRLDGISQDVA
jgi:hypothetical protein